jgi:predicted secreted Zn-dependent protease
MKGKYTRAILAIIILLPILCYADLYYWVDENGVKHFSNVQTENNSCATIRPETSSNTPTFEHPQIEDDASKAPSKRVTYATPPKVHTDFVYYDVQAYNYDELREKALELSPIRHDDKVFLGNTDTNFDYSTTIQKIDGLWHFKEILTSVDIVITLPKWTDYRRAHWEDQKRWDRFYTALTAHENKHKDIAVAATKNLSKALAAIKPTRERSELFQKADNIWLKFLNEHDLLQKQFDKQTDHGRKKGAIL